MDRAMTGTSRFEVIAIGTVESPLTDPASAPKQGSEGAPDASIVLDGGVLDGGVLDAAREIQPGDRVVVLTWLHLADRTVFRVHPRDDARQPLRGVFSTRSADRPNPIGMHVVRVLAVDGPRLRVHGLEAIDGTPVVDIKPALDAEQLA
jgi:tRNA-Thr(GGU) m(6)t(6)A37 methyltransferase TsaA